MSKEQISQGYRERWEERTKGWETPHLRKAMIVGANPGNIGGHITSDLQSRGFDVTPVDKSPIGGAVERFDAAFPAPGWKLSNFDTLILANGQTHLDWIEDQPEVEFFNVLRNKLYASMVCSQEFVRQTLNKPYKKHIVFIGSMAYRSVLNGSAAYCAASAGLVHFARCLAYELSCKGFVVHCVNPSNTEGTPMTEETIAGLARYRDLDRSAAEEYWAASRGLPRWLQPEEIGGIVGDLVTDPKWDMLAGSPIDLNGGNR